MKKGPIKEFGLFLKVSSAAMFLSGLGIFALVFRAHFHPLKRLPPGTQIPYSLYESLIQSLDVFCFHLLPAVGGAFLLMALLFVYQLQKFKKLNEDY